MMVISSWKPSLGCQKVSLGCDFCSAERYLNFLKPGLFDKVQRTARAAE
jgi:protein gp37